MDSNDLIHFDPAGFPLLWIKEIDSFVEFLPITKIQFEFFLSQMVDPRFDQLWYDEILQQNGRISPHLIDNTNYWQLFLTGIRPDEIESFQKWCEKDGHSFYVPTLDLWTTLYQVVKNQKPINIEDLVQHLDQKMHALFLGLEKTVLELCHNYNRSYTLADQMLMRFGIMEWVKQDSLATRWGGMGEPYPSFFPVIKGPDQGIAKQPKFPFRDRMKSYGFRLFAR